MYVYVIIERTATAEVVPVST